jgi:zinc protease
MRTGRSLFLHALFALILFLPSPRAVAADDVLRATLANGLRVVIVKNTLAPVVATEVSYLVGSNEAPDGFPGMAHALEHMMFRGSPGMSAEQLANIMALLGGQFNAATQQTVTQYFFVVPKENLEVALHVEAQRMRGLLNTQELWEQERGAIEQEVAQDLSYPEYVLSTRMLAELFAGTPYAHDALGTRPSFQRTTSAMLKSFYGKWYAPNNAILVIAGDVEPDRALALVKKVFGTVPKRRIPKKRIVTLQPMKAVSLRLEGDLPYGLAVVAYRLPGSDSPDFAAGVILADALDSARSELYGLVPAGKALSTAFDGGALPKAAYGYALAAFPAGGDGDALAETIKTVIAKYMKEGVPPDLVEAAKRHEIADAESQKNSIAGLADAWSQALAVEGRKSPDEDIALIRRVTAADVDRVARQYLRNDRAVTAVLLPRPSDKPTTAKGFGGKESFAPKEAKPVALPPWAAQAETPPGPPAPAVRPAVFTLDNGLRLIVRPTDVSDAITVLGQVKNNDDLEEPIGKEGVSDLLAGLLSYGTASFDRIAFQKAQDDIGAEIRAGTSFSLRVLADRFERGMELLADNLRRPALPEAAFPIVRSASLSALEGQLTSPPYFAKQALREALYPANDPVLRDATPESVSSLSREDVLTYHAKAFRPDMTTIVIVGRISPERARTTVERYFGDWKPRGAAPVTELPPVPPNKPASVLVPDASRVQSEVTLVETVGITRSHPDYYRLQLGNHILSGAFYATRLYRDLRENTGLVYTVESFLEAGKTRALFGVEYACDPPNVAKAREIVEQNLGLMREKPVSAEELQRAKTLLVRQVPLADAGTEDIGGELLRRAMEDLPLDEPVLAAGKYLDMTAEDVRGAFAQWIRPKDFVQITVGPEPESPPAR